MRLSILAFVLYALPWAGCDPAAVEPERPATPPAERAPSISERPEPFAPGTIYVDARRALG